MKENTFVIKEPKPFFFCLPKDIDKNWKHEIEFIIKENEYLAENKIKNETEQLLFIYKKYIGGNNIHEHRKQQNE